jgi:hypothetical protein
MPSSMEYKTFLHAARFIYNEKVSILARADLRSFNEVASRFLLSTAWLFSRKFLFIVPRLGVPSLEIAAERSVAERL